jgi:putative acetyltransferase
MVKLLSTQCARPWTIVRLLPDARHYTVARFRNRQDAHDHLRLLRRFIPAAKFEIIFAPLEAEEQDSHA